MPSLADFSDVELKKMLKQAAKEQKYKDRESVSALEAFCSFLNMAGLGFIADAIRVAQFAWDRIKRIWRSIFGYDVDQLLTELKVAQLRSQIEDIERGLQDLENQSRIARLNAIITLLVGIGLSIITDFSFSELANSGMASAIDKIFGLNAGKVFFNQAGNGLVWIIGASTFVSCLYFYFIATKSGKIRELRNKLEQKKTELKSNERIASSF